MIAIPRIPWRTLCAVFLLAAAALGERLYSVHRVLGATYSFNCTIRAADRGTFLPLRIVGSHGPRLDPREPLQQNYIISPGDDGTLKISGVGYQPRVFGIAVEGYQATTFTINRDTSAEVEVLMSRLKGR